MKSNYKKLDHYIRLVDIRNTSDERYDLLGVSVDKHFIKSIANTIGTDWRTYKVIKKGQFCYIPDTSRRGDKMGIALLTDYDIALVSQAYTVFEIINQEQLLPEYLNLWFKRPEFDRYARFHSHGSVREIFDWEEMCNVELPIPEIEEQRKIVEAYNTIERWIALKRKINDNLEAQAYTYYQDKIANKDKESTLSDLAIITMGTSPDGESFNDIGNGVVFYQGRTDFGFRFPAIRLYTTEPKRFAEKNDILMSVRAPVGDINIAKEYCAIGRGIASIRPKDGCYSFLFYTLKQLNRELQRFNDDGTVFGSITKDDLFALKIVSLSAEDRRKFDEQTSKIDALIKDNEMEIANLELACSLLLSRLAN